AHTARMEFTLSLTEVNGFQPHRISSPEKIPISSASATFLKATAKTIAKTGGTNVKKPYSIKTLLILHTVQTGSQIPLCEGSRQFLSSVLPGSRFSSPLLPCCCKHFQ